MSSSNEDRSEGEHDSKSPASERQKFKWLKSNKGVVLLLKYPKKELYFIKKRWVISIYGKTATFSNILPTDETQYAHLLVNWSVVSA